MADNYVPVRDFVEKYSTEVEYIDKQIIYAGIKSNKIKSRKDGQFQFIDPISATDYCENRVRRILTADKVEQHIKNAKALITRYENHIEKQKEKIANWEVQLKTFA